ncbi:MAG: pyridoxal-phosphate dependent enzyme [Planctomycetes bacterium]|nr:pyridoxal-phosphate dependent enzyme [Planctomycetota bacterium]
MSLSSDCLGIPELRGLIRRLPRVFLAHVPTPLDYAARLSRHLGVRLYIKRDDATGLGLGGNKVRQLEFTLGEAVRRGADCIVQGAAEQSNHCRQAAAAAARLGLDCYLVLSGDARGGSRQGNRLLDELFGARIERVETDMGQGIQEAKKAVAQRLLAEGRRPYLIAPPDSLGLGAVAFVDAFLELMEQAREQEVSLQHLFVCSCGATGGGLILANRCLATGLRIRCVSPILWEWPTDQRLAEAANTAARVLGLDTRVTPSEVDYTNAFVGPGYGIPSSEGCEAMSLAARQEGIVLDPIYTAKAFAALAAAVRSGEVPPGSTVLFWHTGGSPALFAFPDSVGA